MQDYDSEKLEKCDGRDGRPVCVAVRGKVYDLSGSDLWKGGKHMGQHTAGRELGDVIGNAPHGEEVFEKYRQIGILRSAPESRVKQSPGWAALLLKQHPHPITVHFPQALLTLAPLFLVLFYLTGNLHFERTCYYLGVTGLLTAAPAVMTGFFHWFFKYAGSRKGIFMFKMTVSLLLFAYTAVVVVVHTSKGVLLPEPVDVTMLILYLVVVPLAVITGHTGGKIVFG